MESDGVLTIIGENTHCTPCSSKDKKVAFNHYCIDCEAYYCNECFEFHLRIPYLAKHIVLKKEEVEVWSNLQYRCKPHGRNFEFFCRNHKKLCCHICVSLQHRSCNKIDYIPECANDKSLKKEVTSMIGRIDGNLQNIDTYKEKFQMKSSTNDDSKLCCLEAITDCRTRINAILDELETKTKEIMERKFEKNSSYATENSNELNKLKCGLERLNQQLHTSSKGKEILVYIGLLEGETFVEEVEGKLSRMDISDTKENFGLVLDKQLERFLKSISSFGCITNKQMSSDEICSEELPEDDFNEKVTLAQNDNEINIDVDTAFEMKSTGFPFLEHEIVEADIVPPCELTDASEEKCELNAVPPVFFPTLRKQTSRQKWEHYEILEEKCCFMDNTDGCHNIPCTDLSQQYERPEELKEKYDTDVAKDLMCKNENDVRNSETKVNQVYIDHGYIQIFVKRYGEKTTVLDVNTTDTIAQVKAKLMQKTNTKEASGRKFYLMYGMKRLRENKSVGYYNLQQNCTLETSY